MNVFVIVSFVYSYGYIEPFFVLMEVISVSNDGIWLIDVTMWRTVKKHSLVTRGNP